MRERAVDLSLTQRVKKREKKRKRNNFVGEAKLWEKSKKQVSRLNSHCHTLSSFFPSSTMPDREIGDDASDTNLSSSFASSSSSFSSYYSAAGAWTDDHAAKMEKDPRKIARRFDFPDFLHFRSSISPSVSLLSRFGFRTLSLSFRLQVCS